MPRSEASASNLADVGLRSKDLGKLRALAMLRFKPHCRSGTLGATGIKRASTTVTYQLITVVVADALCGRAHLTREDAVRRRLTQRALTSEVSDDRYCVGLGRELCADNCRVVCRARARIADRDRPVAASICSAQGSTGVFD